jgi:hypothetical protein
VDTVVSVLATANLLEDAYTGDAVPARTDSFERIWAIASAGDIWPASTAPMAEPMMIPKFEPEPE